MFTGETITAIINAEPAGFILTFSHGRVAHLTLRDQLGRPAVGVQFLRKASSGSQNGIFGSIRNVFSGSGRKVVAAVHAGRASRGQRDVMIVTGDAEIEIWDTRHNVGNSIKFSLDAKEELLNNLKDNMPPDGQSNYHFSVLDFAFVAHRPNGHELAKTDGDSAEEVLFLVALSQTDRTYYYIMETTLSVELIRVNTVYPVNCYRKAIRTDATLQPRLSVPQPGRTAFIIFESAIVLYSLARLRESPSSQLLSEGGSAPEPFQDCIRFQEDTSFHVLTVSPEDQNDDRKHPSIVTAVQSFGLVRVSAIHAQMAEEDAEDGIVTPKSKIEQAVFFGSLKNNPLDLVSKGEQQFDQEEVEAAALEISKQILTSSSKYLPKATPSVEQNLRSRSKAHDDLALHLSKHYDPLSRSARFQLLWNAEKLASQRALWRAEEEHRKRRPEGEVTVLQEILFYLHPREKTQINKDKGENDRVRHWMTFDADRINAITPWLAKIHGELYKDEVTEPKPVSENISETVDLVEAMYETAYKFREDNASAYGLSKETFKNGVLHDTYQGLPEPWTAKDWQKINNLVKLSNEFARKWWVVEGKPSPENPDPKTVYKIGASLGRQTRILSRSMLEKANWLIQQDKENPRPGEAIVFTHKYFVREQMLSMAGLGFSQEAIALAEQFVDMDILVELNVDALVQLNDQFVANEIDPEHYEREAKKVNDRMDSYFDKYKDRWAKAYYEKMIQDSQLGSLLNDEQHQARLTQYLRSKPAYGKISWINDIIGEKSFISASETLVNVAETQETDLWSKKVELCLSKLATLATVERDAKIKNHQAKETAAEGETKPEKFKPIPTDRQASRISSTTSSIQLLDLQTRLYLHVTSLIGRNILDLSTRQDLAFEILGKTSPSVKDKPAFKGLLYDGLGLLLNQESLTIDQLVDVLTLMSPVGETAQDKITAETLDAGVIGNEFFFALKAIDFALPPPSSSTSAADDPNALEKRTKREALQSLVWRRVLLRDNWIDLNNTASKSDEAVTESMKESNLGVTAFQLLSDSFSSSSSPAPLPSTATIPPPQKILDATLFPEVLKQRFKPQELDLVEKDLEKENAELELAMEKGRVGVWFDGIVEESLRDVEQAQEDEDEDDVEMGAGEAEGDGGTTVVNGGAEGDQEEKGAEKESGRRTTRTRSVRFKEAE